MSLQFAKSKIGDAEIIQVVEVEIGYLVKNLLPEATPDLMREISWMKPPYVDENYELLASSQCFVIKIKDRILVVDTCVGNDKTLKDISEWNEMQLEFLETLDEIGIDRNAVTDVLCTHLHFDHVGWNTYKKNGKWLPTFPNAKYHIAQIEYDFFHDENNPADPMYAMQNDSMAESVTPIVEAGLINLIDINTDLGDGIKVFSTPGHTKGHIAIEIDAGSEKFIIGGDMCHHPVQIAKPDMPTVVDYDNVQSCETRRNLLSNLTDTKTLFACTHFRVPSFGLITKESGEHFVFNTVDKRV